MQNLVFEFVPRLKILETFEKRCRYSIKKVLVQESIWSIYSGEFSVKIVSSQKSVQSRECPVKEECDEEIIRLIKFTVRTVSDQESVR